MAKGGETYDGLGEGGLGFVLQSTSEKHALNRAKLGLKARVKNTRAK